MKTIIFRIPVIVLITILTSLLIILACSPQQQSEYERKSNAIVSAFTSSFNQRYGDQCSLHYKSLTPSKGINEYLNIYEGIITLDPPNIVQRTLSKYVNAHTLDSMRLVSKNKSWQEVIWQVENIKLSQNKSQILRDDEIKLFISSVIFNPTYDRAIIYVETHRKHSTSGSLYSFKLETTGEWTGSPCLPVFSAG